MKRVLITGIAGTGKSTVARQLVDLGYESLGIEDVPGMFRMFHKSSGKPFDDFDNSPEHIEDSEWLCDVGKLKELLAAQKSDVGFYAGVASNMDEIIPLFDKMIVLKADKETIHARLKNREGTNDIGNTEESRQVVLGWKDWWEGEMRDRGAIEVSAEGSAQEVAKRVLEVVTF